MGIMSIKPLKFYNHQLTDNKFAPAEQKMRVWESGALMRVTGITAITGMWTLLMSCFMLMLVDVIYRFYLTEQK